MRLGSVSTSRAVLTVFALAVGTLGSGQVRGQNMHCLVEMEIPRYSGLARLALKTGTVVSRITIGSDGRPAEFYFDSPDQRLSGEVQAWLEGTARFQPSCRGETVSLLFTFRLEGEPREAPFTIVRFRPPNHFIIITQPQIPHIQVRSPPPRKSGGSEQSERK